MRTVYFVEPGQRLNDIKPSKRNRALLLTKQEWQHFGNYMVKKQKELEAIETAVVEKENRKLCSEEMAKTWDNTIINQRRKRLQRLREQQAKIEADRVRRYLEMRKEEAEARKKIVEEAKQLMRLEKDTCKSLLSALKFSEVLRERQAQLEFEDKLKAIEAEREHEYACKVKADAEQYGKEMKEKQQQEREKQQKLCRERMVEMQGFMESKEKLEATEKEFEIQDNINIAKEIEVEKQNALKERQRKMMIERENIKENRRLIEEAKARLKLEAEEETNAIQIHANAKVRIAKMRKQKELQTAIEQQKRRDKISEAVAKDRGDRDAVEKEIIRRAIEEKEALEVARREKQETHRKQLREERKKDREAFLEEEKQRVENEREEFCKEVRQRFMSEQENKEYFENLERQKVAQMKYNKAVWDKQCEEMYAVRAEERAQDIAAVDRAAHLVKKEDGLFLKYAEDVVEECKRKGRPLYPVLCNIEEYKRQSGLLPTKKQHIMWKSKVPINIDESLCKPVKVCGRKPHDPWPNMSELENKKEPGTED